MTILVVDDEYIELKGVSDIIRKIRPDDEILCAGNSGEAIKLAGKKRIDIAFLDIEMPGTDGLKLAERLKKDNGDINIIFTTAYDRYMKEAFNMHASGYLLKPVTEEMIKKELSDLRYTRDKFPKRVKVVTFGHFAVFIDGAPARFRYSKTEELFAILVDLKGEFTGYDQAARILWEEDMSSSSHSSYIVALKKDLIQTFSSAGVDGIFRFEGQRIAIDPDMIDCDFYDYMEGKEGAEPFKDVYMEKFAWAEPTVGFLNNLARKRGQE